MPEILEKNRMFVRTYAGKATLENEEVELSTSLHGFPIVRFEDGTTVYWTWEELLEQAIELKKKNPLTAISEL